MEHKVRHSAIEFCPFCGHWINESAKKCNNCGEFLNIKAKRSLWYLVPNLAYVLATIVIAVCAVLGAIKIADILQRERIKVVENHLTWIEISPIDFTTKGEVDASDSSKPVLWYLHIQAQNLGKKTGYFYIKNWEFKSDRRGPITKDAYKDSERKFTVHPGEKIIWTISFVMSSEYHIKPIINGEDALEIKLVFSSIDMSGLEECEYNALWEYTKGQFSIIEDSRQYHRK